MPERISTGRRQFLLIDDNPSATAMLELLLKDEGFEVETTHSGEAALELIDEWHPSVVLLDLGLPGMSGFDVAREFCQRLHPRPLIIAYTGFSDPEVQEQARQAGCDHVAVKPVDIDQLIELTEQTPITDSGDHHRQALHK